MQNENPLVSVIVITYNSSKYVLETLESAKAQTYQNIELIVSDDCSTDNTVEICKQWIDENKGRFVRTELITAKKNTGIPANCNRGVNAAQGEWVKLIAGDDILLDDCILINISYCKDIEDIAVVFSNYKRFHIDSGKKIFLPTIKKSTNDYNLYFSSSVTIKKQAYGLATGKFDIPGCVYFYNKAKLNEINGFDEEFYFAEDIPSLFEFLNNGNKLHYINEFTVMYRKNSNAITSKMTIKFHHDYTLLYTKHIKHFISKKLFLYHYDQIIHRLSRKLQIRSISPLENKLAKGICLFSPIFVLKIIRRKVI